MQCFDYLANWSILVSFFCTTRTDSAAPAAPFGPHARHSPLPVASTARSSPRPGHEASPSYRTPWPSAACFRLGWTIARKKTAASNGSIPHLASRRKRRSRVPASGISRIESGWAAGCWRLCSGCPVLFPQNAIPQLTSTNGVVAEQWHLVREYDREEQICLAILPVKDMAERLKCSTIGSTPCPQRYTATACYGLCCKRRLAGRQLGASLSISL